MEMFTCIGVYGEIRTENYVAKFIARTELREPPGIEPWTFTPWRQAPYPLDHKGSNFKGGKGVHTCVRNFAAAVAATSVSSIVAASAAAAAAAGISALSAIANPDACCSYFCAP